MPKQKIPRYESGDFLERVNGIEPSSSPWKGDIIAIIRHPQELAYSMVGVPRLELGIPSFARLIRGGETRTRSLLLPKQAR